MHFQMRYISCRKNLDFLSSNQKFAVICHFLHLFQFFESLVKYSKFKPALGLKRPIEEENVQNKNGRKFPFLGIF